MKSYFTLSAICVGLACILVAGCGSKRDLFYPTLADAEKAGELNRGWIPDYLPKTSRAIHLVEQDSPSKEWGSFEFLPNDSQSLRKRFKSTNALPPSVKRVTSPDVSWWPAVLKGNLDLEKTHQMGFELYVVEEPADSVSTWVEFFAIDWRKGHGFFYGRRE